MSDELTPGRTPSLDSLKKQAKRWLDALRHDLPEARARLARALPHPPDTPTLRDVQLALAREQGFSGWAALKQALLERATPNTLALRRFDEMAEALLEAYRTGRPEAMERHWSLTWHRRAWQAMRRYVQLDLGRQEGDPKLEDDITLDDAKLLVAREHGFANWKALATQMTAAPAFAKPLLLQPVELLSVDEEGDVRPAGASRDWGEVLTRLQETGIAGVDARGAMTDAMLKQLAGLGHLSVLRLGGSRAVTDEGIRQLADLPQLRQLDLSGTGVTDAGLAALRGLTHLERVSLAWTRVTDAGAAILTNGERLRRVDLSGTATGDGALRALAGKPLLHELRTGDLVTDAGLALLAGFPIFRDWHGGEESLELLGEFNGPNYLYLRGRITDRGLAELSRLHGLYALNLDDRALGLGASALAHLVELPHLGRLAVDAADDAMPLLAAMPHLRYLSCQDSVAGDDGFSALSRSKSIEYIWGRRTHHLHSRGFQALATMPRLRGLSLSCRNVDDVGVAMLPHFPALRELMPMDIPDAGYRHIGRCDRLESLVLMYCRETGDAATEQITGLPRLARYFASYNRITDRTPELLAGMPALERITFDSCAGLTDAGIAHLARLPRLKELRVSGQRISAQVGRPFGPGVRVDYSV